MKRKKLRIPLIVLAVIAILVACYVGFFMRAQPLLDCLPGTQPPAAGEVVRYTQDQPDGQSPWTILNRCRPSGRPSSRPRSAFCGAGERP